MFKRRFAFAAEHPRDLFLARFPSDFMQIGKRATAHDVFGYNEMRVRPRMTSLVTTKCEEAVAATWGKCVMQIT